MNATGQELKAVRVDLPLDVHHALRIAATHVEKSMGQYVRDLVEADPAVKQAKMSIKPKK
jgi:hypothetical protein